jgi:hypothetical protein
VPFDFVVVASIFGGGMAAVSFGPSVDAAFYASVPGRIGHLVEISMDENRKPNKKPRIKDCMGLMEGGTSAN